MYDSSHPRNTKYMGKLVKNESVGFDIAEIESRVLIVRGVKVLLDVDVSELYDYENKELTRRVNTNKGYFPDDDFVFELTDNEKKRILAENPRLEKIKYSRVPTKAFPEHGVYMLASVLKSETAMLMCVQIIRTFIKLNRNLNQHSLTDDTQASYFIKRISELEDENEQLKEWKDLVDFKFDTLFEEIQTIKETNKKKIGF